MNSPTNKTLLTAGGGVAAAFASALCCAGPLLAVAAGVSGAGLASSFEPLRPYFLVATAMLLGLGFYLLRREGATPANQTGLAPAPVRRRMRRMLWTATIISAVFATYPTWSGLVL
ncbi:MAG: hypothetical protein IPO52_15230 [Gemmatimonadetes bacterium]|nr:hypothetical protein [Gemmatimonadota bacterium]